jgi:uncharacterized membrane protein YccC
MDPMQWINLGTAVACLVALATAIWYVGAWIAHKADTILAPLVSRHIRFLDELTARQAEGHDRAQRILDTVERMLANQNDLLRAWNESKRQG